MKNSFRENETNKQNIVSPKNFKDIYNCYMNKNSINNYLKNVKYEMPLIPNIITQNSIGNQEGKNNFKNTIQLVNSYINSNNNTIINRNKNFNLNNFNSIQ